MLTRLFKNKPAPALEALRKAVAENAAGEVWREGFWTQARARESALVAAADAFSLDPNDGTAAAYLQTHRANLDTLALGRLANLALETLGRKALDRTRPVLAEALRFSSAQLSKELDAIRARDAESAEQLGVESVETVSPICGRIAGKLREGETFLSNLDAAKTIGDLSGPIQFCLS